MNYLLENPNIVWERTLEHLAITVTALGIALLIALPLGLLVARAPRLRGPVLGVLGVVYTIPSLSLLVLLIPLMGLGFWPAVTALVAYAQIVLVRNVLVGITGVDPAIVEAARGVGMSGRQLLLRIELPLALPLILAGVRVATLAIIGIGTIAAYINAGGLGRLLFEGVTTGNPEKIVAGAVAVSALALAVNGLLWIGERASTRSLR
jgi:osmoprotectant transport system permease protein